jgi:hypothetical protein
MNLYGAAPATGRECLPLLPPLSQRFLEFAGRDLPPPEEEDHFLATARVFGLAWNRAVFPEGSLGFSDGDRT